MKTEFGKAIGRSNVGCSTCHKYMNITAIWMPVCIKVFAPKPHDESRLSQDKQPMNLLHGPCNLR